MRVAIYPGTFDPITNGHLDIATRAAKLFDKLIIGVFETPNKPILFNAAERVKLIEGAIAGLSNVEVESFGGLTVNFAKRVNAVAMVRGLRMSADFEREFDMAMMTKKLYPDLEFVCLMSRVEYQFLSSSLLKEAASLGGDIHDLVPAHVVEALKVKFKGKF
ncbi:MAG TPA: pantetheine-phosphate adenylyltransferase [Dehalococcoidales bacterium]|nr:pantetheine-phosphate adenylyltransferase [Dehalococcoidales bacterium]